MLSEWVITPCWDTWAGISLWSFCLAVLTPGFRECTSTVRMEPRIRVQIRDRAWIQYGCILEPSCSGAAGHARAFHRELLPGLDQSISRMVRRPRNILLAGRP